MFGIISGFIRDVFVVLRKEVKLKKKKVKFRDTLLFTDGNINQLSL